LQNTPAALLDARTQRLDVGLAGTMDRLGGGGAPAVLRMGGLAREHRRRDHQDKGDRSHHGDGKHGRCGADEQTDHGMHSFFGHRAGLGLAIARQVIEGHGGTIEIGDAPAAADGTRRGARFTVTLPMAG
jgi:hypothetical protein